MDQIGKFTLHKTEGKARRGTFTTTHGSFETPVFMAVGTKATVKAMKAHFAQGLEAAT